MQVYMTGWYSSQWNFSEMPDGGKIGFILDESGPLNLYPELKERVGKTCGSGPYLHARGEIPADSSLRRFIKDHFVFGVMCGPTPYYDPGSYTYLEHGGDHVTIIIRSGDYRGNCWFTYTEWQARWGNPAKLYQNHPENPSFIYVDEIRWEEYRRESWRKSEYCTPEAMKTESYKIRVGDPYRSTHEFSSVGLYDDFEPAYWDWKDFHLSNNIVNIWESIQAFNFTPINTERALTSAYVDAVSTMPSIMVGALGNILSTVDSLLDLISGGFSPKRILKWLKELAREDFGKKLADFWLTKRYQVSTTISDINEYSEVLSRLSDLSRMSSPKLYGQFIDKNWTYKVSFQLPIEELVPMDLLSMLNAMGLKFTLADIWDVVPFSFMVDWFASVGDLLSMVDVYSKSVTLHPKDIWVSMYSSEDNTYIRYNPDQFRGLPYFFQEDDTSASGQTIAFRIADAVSIFLL